MKLTQHPNAPRMRLGALGAGVLLPVLIALFMASAGAGSASPRALAAPPPENISPPTITGKAYEGQILRATVGRWRPSTVRGAVFTFYWRRCAPTGTGCVDLARANDSIYAVRHRDVGQALRVTVTATIAGLSASAASAPTARVDPVGIDVPVNTIRPTITGKPLEGAVLTAQAGTWSGKQPIQFRYRWRSCAKLGGSCRDHGAGQTYTLRSRDVDHVLRVLVLAQNALHTSAALSVPTASVSDTTPPAAGAAPSNTVEPQISGTPRVGQVLRSTRGTWTGTPPITYEHRWFRCQGRGAPDASDCTRIANASNASYVLREADAGFRIRSQVLARNADGRDTATSNPTAIVQSARPTNTTEPSISGTAAVGNRLTANRGEWIGEQPITYSFQWLRCNQAGDNCSEVPGATDNQYVVVDGDVGRTLRVRVTARNDVGTRSALSNPTSVVGSNQPPPPPPGSPLPVEDLKAAGDRLVIASVQFSPNPVTSRTAPITVRVRVTARQGRPVSGALVFMRGTPRVVEGQTQATQADGFVTLTLVPNRLFPQPRSGFNVQFFIKAFRRGDPGLGGIAGYRLVQVRLAG